MTRTLDRFEGIERPLGLNPAFVRRTREKRRAAKAEAALQRDAARLAREREEAARREREAIDAELAALEAERQLAAQRLALNAARSAADLAGRRAARSIIREVAARHGVAVDAMLGASRSKPLVRARFEAIRLVRIGRPDLSLPAIGRIFNRDHTTILHALRRADTVIGPQRRRRDGSCGSEVE